MAKDGRAKLLEQYEEYIKRDPKLRKMMEQLRVDQKIYLDALYQIESEKVIPDRIYTDTTHRG